MMCQPKNNIDEEDYEMFSYWYTLQKGTCRGFLLFENGFQKYTSTTNSFRKQDSVSIYITDILFDEQVDDSHCSLKVMFLFR